MTESDKPLDDASYEAIEAAVMESERGRWFLNEFARRNRNSDTLSVLRAIEKMQGAIPGRSPRLVYLESEIADIAALVATGQAAIAATRRDDPVPEADESTDPVLRTARAAADGMANATEQIQDLAWALRQRGAEETLCTALEKHAGDLHTLGLMQDITVRRLGQALALLASVEQRLRGLAPREEAPRAGRDKPDVVVSLPGGSDNGLRRRRTDAPARMSAAPETTSQTSRPDDAASHPAQPAQEASPSDEPPVARTAPSPGEVQPARVRRYAGNVVFVDPGNTRRGSAALARDEAPQPVPQRQETAQKSDEPRFEPSVLAAFDALSWQEKLRRFT